MGISYNPSSVVSGLVLALDAGNTKSYPGSGSTWTDLSGRGNNLTLTGSTYSSTSGGSLVFDGTTTFAINSATNSIPTGNSDRTVQLWVYPTLDTNVFFQLGTGGGGNQVYNLQYYNITGTVYLFTDGINGGNNLTISGSQLPSLNSWNYLVFGNSGQNWFYYKNAILQNSGTWATTLNTIGQKVIIGKRDDTGASFAKGNISNASIYNKALSASEISQNFNALRGRFGI
jgi:hypothetical protein